MHVTTQTDAPSLTSGFGAVMEQEREVQSATEGYLDAEHGPRTSTIDRILRHQYSRIGANIALLVERYEMLPHPVRFRSLPAKRTPPPGTRRRETLTDDPSFLPGLVGQHLTLLRKIDALIEQRPDGQRGELILTEVARNHAEMAWMLTALIKEDESVHDMVPTPIIAGTPATPQPARESNWENEGGATREGSAVK